MPDKTWTKISDQLEECSIHLEKLNDWETNFIETTSDQFSHTGSLSEKQQEILQKIYDGLIN